MFEDLRRAFREAVDNFREELNRDDVPENVDRLLKGMIDEVTESKARLADLESQLEKTEALLQHQRTELETARRREGMARGIGDEETAEVARSFAAKHEERVGILERKRGVLEEEVALLRAEVSQMMTQLKDARSRRDGLTAEAGRAGARNTIGESRDAFDEFDRMAAEIEGQDAEASAWEELARERSEFSIDFDEAPKRPEVDYDAALEELKRRMKDR